MHTSFTGNSRRPRQVNLSGRNSNPWAKASASPVAFQPQLSSHNAVAQAQADRARRAHERDRLNAARKLQRVWRGHSSRCRQRHQWREEWDANEQRRTGQSQPILYQNMLGMGTSRGAAYQNEEDLYHQLRLLLSFLRVHEETDRWRLCFFGNNLVASWALTEHPADPVLWSRRFSKLIRLTAAALSSSIDLSQTTALLRIGLEILQKPVQLDYDAQFKSLKVVLNTDLDGDTLGLVSDYAQALLLRKDISAYDAFVRVIVSYTNVNVLPNMTHFIAISQHQLAFCHSLRKTAQELTTHHALWILANAIHLWRSIRPEEKAIDWVSAISDVLTKCANEVALRIDDMDQTMTGTDNPDTSSFDPFIRNQITTLSLQESVQYVMRQFRSSTKSVAEVAKPLANYAVALLRAFPSKATNIRMWLYQSSPSTAVSGGSSSTINYLWRATQSTAVFQIIRNDQSAVISTLTEVRPYSNQFGVHYPTAEETSTWREEWRIVLLFLELYSFILKLMDDEEFFALDENKIVTSDVSSQFRQGALPLVDIASLGSFLKHLAFSLYWNAADLAEYNELEESTSISMLFGQSTGSPSLAMRKSTAKTLAGNDVSQSYMKGLATGLLRMLYERDSRRKFMPENYWLMTKHFDMQGFIPAVVAEEERRYEASEEEDDEEVDLKLQNDDDDEANDLHLPTLGSLFNIRAPHMPRSQTSRQAEQLTKQREVARKRRQLQSLAPRLELLRNLPFFIPFDTRVQIFRTFVYHDQQRRRNGYVDPDEWRMSVAATQAWNHNGVTRAMDMIGRHSARINRGSVFEDAYDSFYDLGEALKEPISISFIDQFGQPEAGIDGGGVTKEFLMSVTSEALNPKARTRMFEENEQRYLYPAPTTLQQVRYMLTKDGNRPGSEGYNMALRETLQRYEFIGRIVGKCMYEGILIDVNFAGFFLLKWALTGGTTSASTESAFRASINDLRDFDDQLYQNLLKLKNYPGDVEADFGINFTANDEFEVDGRPVVQTIDLIPGGSNAQVTKLNRLKYIDRIVRYRLQEQPRLITNAFLKGLSQIISPMWLAMFNQKELQKLVGGDNQELDISDLRRNTQYGGVYVIGDDGLEHPIVAMFWKVLKEMSDEDRRKVLKFVTSTPRAPLLGFSHLNPKFSIRDSSEDQTRLPSTSTCVNLLKLPRYMDEKTMREKLLYAANAGAGFDLS